MVSLNVFAARLGAICDAICANRLMVNRMLKALMAEVPLAVFVEWLEDDDPPFGWCGDDRRIPLHFLASHAVISAYAHRARRMTQAVARLTLSRPVRERLRWHADLDHWLELVGSIAAECRKHEAKHGLRETERYHADHRRFIQGHRRWLLYVKSVTASRGRPAAMRGSPPGFDCDFPDFR